MTTPCASDPARWAEATKPDAEAQAMCRTQCPIRDKCLDLASGKDRVVGIWGGFFLPDPVRHPQTAAKQVKGMRHALSVVKQQVA